MKLIFAMVVLATELWAAEVKPLEIVAAARNQIGRTTSYDPAYRKIDFPGGDVPMATGVCSDVVIRALRAQGVDLQKLVHEDMKQAFSAYPKNWGLKKPDPNIDHRRVLNLMTYFRRQGFALAATHRAENFAAGDIVTWNVGRNLPHVGIVSDRRTPNGTPLIIHNIGSGAQEEDLLFKHTVTGQYRWK